MRVLGSDRGLAEISFNDDSSTTIPRAADGTFHVDDFTGKRLIESGDFAQVGVSLGTLRARGYRCACGFLGLFRDRCGRCGSTDLRPE